MALTSLLVASGIGVAVVPALGADNAPAAAALDSDRDRGPGHARWFHDRGDVRYVWFRLCDGTTNGATTTATTSATTTETIAPDAIAAAVEGAAVETATTTDTATTETTETTETTAETTTTETTTVAKDDPNAEAYPTFVVVPLSKDEAKALRKLDERPCYDPTTGAPGVTGARTRTDATTTDSATGLSETTTTPVAPGTTG